MKVLMKDPFKYLGFLSGSKKRWSWSPSVELNLMPELTNSLGDSSGKLETKLLRPHLVVRDGICSDLPPSLSLHFSTQQSQNEFSVPILNIL